jgi:hypothetical protein
MRFPNPKNIQITLHSPNEMEDLKLSSVMRLKKEEQKIGIPPTYITSKALNESSQNLP